MFGLIGSGRSELAQAICALGPRKSGEVYYMDKKVNTNIPQESIDNGIVYLTEDRKEQGLFLNMSIKKNISAEKLKN